MANHRAEKPKASRRRSAATPEPAPSSPSPSPSSEARTGRSSRSRARSLTDTRALSQADSPTIQQAAVQEPVTRQATTQQPPQPGRRRAVKPTRTERRAAQRPEPQRAQRPERPEPQRAQRPERPLRPERPQPKRAQRPHAGARGRKRLLPLPSASVAIGAAAVALAAAGTITVSQAGFGSQLTSSGVHKVTTQASVLNGASSIGSSDALSGRQRAVSRDSERQALKDAANQQLQAAANQQAKQRNAALAELAASAQKHADALARNAWGLPIPHGVYHLTAGFGDVSSLWATVHTGQDFACSTGTPIHAVATGVITSTGYDGSYGNKTVETLPDGTELWYAHQNSFNVSSGEHVLRGQVIGFVGSTGNVTGPHLHLEVRPGGGDPVDPYAALVAHGLRP